MLPLFGYFGHDKPPPICGAAFYDVDQFFVCMKEDRQKYDVWMWVEPGDMTRYEMIIIDVDRDLFLIVIPDINYSLTWGKGCFLDINELPFSNDYTRCVYTDLVNRKMEYYDWVLKKPKGV